MQSSQLKDKDLGVVTTDAKFCDLRKRAQDEYRLRKVKRDKDKSTPVPKYQIGDIVVVSNNRFSKSDRDYDLFEILDFKADSVWDGFVYYGIRLNTTNKDKSMLLRLDSFQESNHIFNRGIVNVPVSSIKWDNADIEAKILPETAVRLKRKLKKKV